MTLLVLVIHSNILRAMGSSQKVCSHVKTLQFYLNPNTILAASHIIPGRCDLINIPNNKLKIRMSNYFSKVVQSGDGPR